jgi:hypothetical protein
VDSSRGVACSRGVVRGRISTSKEASADHFEAGAAAIPGVAALPASMRLAYHFSAIYHVLDGIAT